MGAGVVVWLKENRGIKPKIRLRAMVVGFMMAEGFVLGRKVRKKGEAEEKLPKFPRQAE